MKRLIVPVLYVSVALVLLFTGWYFLIQREAYPADTGSNNESRSLSPPVLLFGIPVDSFEVISSSVKNDDNLGGILSEYDLGNASLVNITDSVKKIFDVTDLRKGNHYTVFLSPDSLQLRYFVYEHSPVDYLFVEVQNDSISACMQQKTIITKRKIAQGVVHSSLWNTMKDRGYNPVMALELSEVYAWTIDFFGLQEGDRFKVIYDEMYVDTVSLGVGKIHAAIFKHNGREIAALPFTQDGRESYFDQDGGSLRRAFLKAPLRYSRIGSRFSNNRMHPILRIRRPHHAVDYSAPAGTSVQSIGDGKVIQMGYNGASGNMVKIRHNSVYTSVYLHLSGYARELKTGAQVVQGQTIGYVGSTGLSTGPHLDFRIYKNGTPIDPLKVEAPSVEPVRPENMAAFDSIRNILMGELVHIH